MTTLAAFAIGFLCGAVCVLALIFWISEEQTSYNDHDHAHHS